MSKRLLKLFISFEEWVRDFESVGNTMAICRSLDMPTQFGRRTFCDLQEVYSEPKKLMPPLCGQVYSGVYSWVLCSYDKQFITGHSSPSFARASYPPVALKLLAANCKWIQFTVWWPSVTCKLVRDKSNSMEYNYCKGMNQSPVSN